MQLIMKSTTLLLIVPSQVLAPIQANATYLKFTMLLHIDLSRV